jgi:hypothetical protein
MKVIFYCFNNMDKQQDRRPYHKCTFELERTVTGYLTGDLICTICGAKHYCHVRTSSSHYEHPPDFQS